MDGKNDIRHGTWTGKQIEFINEQHFLTAKVWLYDIIGGGVCLYMYD